MQSSKYKSTPHHSGIVKGYILIYSDIIIYLLIAFCITRLNLHSNK